MSVLDPLNPLTPLDPLNPLSLLKAVSVKPISETLVALQHARNLTVACAWRRDSDSDDGLVPYEMDELEPDSTHATATATTATTTNKSKKKRDDDDDDEAMSGSKRIGEGRVPLPTRVRQCLAGLRSQSPDDVEAAMFAIEGVVLASQDLQGEGWSGVCLLCR